MSSNSNTLSKADSLSEEEKQAFARVLKAGVKAPESAIIDFIRCVGAKSLIAAKLKDIRAVANAF